MVLAAGRGERMRPLTDACPKPLLPVGGKPLIVWQIERLVRAGFDELVINVSYRAPQITEYLGDGARFGARIRYSHEVEPLESAGGLAHALPLLGEGPVLVVAADVYAEFDYAGLAASRRASPESPISSLRLAGGSMPIVRSTRLRAQRLAAPFIVAMAVRRPASPSTCCAAGRRSPS